MTAAYVIATMAHTLESVEPGTPVFAGDTCIGHVRAAFTEASSRSVDLLVVHHDARDEDVVVPSGEVLAVDDAGVQLMGRRADEYRDLAPFDAARFPTMKQLK